MSMLSDARSCDECGHQWRSHRNADDNPGCTLCDCACWEYLAEPHDDMAVLLEAAADQWSTGYTLHSMVRLTRDAAAEIRRLRAVAARVPLFQVGQFTLASGAAASWKIECDALTEADWAGLAAMAVDLLPPFCFVAGVPRGGLPFAEALRPYGTGDPFDPALVADDVWTTGGSIKRHIAAVGIEADALKVVAFARNPVTDGTLALFTIGTQKPLGQS